MLFCYALHVKCAFIEICKKVKFYHGLNCVVDFSDALSKLTLSEHPSSLFTFHSEAVQRQYDVAVMPSESVEVISSNSSRKTFRQNRSSSSGFSLVEQELETFRQTSSVNEAKCEVSSERQSRCHVTSQSLGTMPLDLTPQQKSDEHSIPSVKSWAAVLISGKTAKQPTLASVVQGKVDIPSWADKLKCRSASRDADRMQLLSSDGKRSRMKSNDRVSVNRQENQSAAWGTVRDKQTKPRSQMPQLHSNVSTHLAGSCVAVKSKRDKKDESAGITDGPAAAGSQSRATKQKRKKKKKSKGSDVATDETLDAVKRMEETVVKTALPVPEFHNADEFPSLFGSKSASKKTSLQTPMPSFSSGIFIIAHLY